MDISSFFDGMDTLLKTFWYIAIPASVVFAVQSILTFTGGDASDGLDADFDGDLDHAQGPSQIFSFRNLINFLLGFSWSGISLYNSISNTTLLIAVSFVIGLAFLFLFFLVIKQIQGLAENNSFSFDQTIGKHADVYLTIPANKSGKGKVSISVNGSHHELDAITEGENLPSGSLVVVKGIEAGNLLIVSKI